jgi:hypothetical protein
VFSPGRAKKHCPLVFSQGRWVECAGPCQDTPAQSVGAAPRRRPQTAAKPDVVVIRMIKVRASRPYGAAVSKILEAAWIWLWGGSLGESAGQVLRTQFD